MGYNDFFLSPKADELISADFRQGECRGFVCSEPCKCVGQHDDDRRIGVGLVEHLLEKYIRSENCTLFVDFEGTAQEILGECHHQNRNARHVCT
jgi:hypothetical protein